MTVAYQPQLLGYLTAPCPNHPATTHAIPVHLTGSPGVVVSRMPLGPETRTQLCPHCRPPAPPSLDGT